MPGEVIIHLPWPHTLNSLAPHVRDLEPPMTREETLHGFMPSWHRECLHGRHSWSARDPIPALLGATQGRCRSGPRAVQSCCGDWCIRDAQEPSWVAGWVQLTQAGRGGALGAESRRAHAAEAAAGVLAQLVIAALVRPRAALVNICSTQHQGTLSTATPHRGRSSCHGGLAHGKRYK